MGQKRPKIEHFSHPGRLVDISTYRPRVPFGRFVMDNHWFNSEAFVSMVLSDWLNTTYAARPHTRSISWYDYFYKTYFQGACVFQKSMCPEPVGDAASPHQSGEFPISWKGARPNFMWKQARVVKLCKILGFERLLYVFISKCLKTQGFHRKPGFSGFNDEP